MQKLLLAAGVIAFGSTGYASAQSTAVTGKIVDFATYVTRDHNMDVMHGAMKGEAMKGDATHEDAMHGNAMHGGGAMRGDTCPEILGIVTPDGRAFPLATQIGSRDHAVLCKSVGRTVTIHGKTYTQAGASVFLVSSK